MRFAVFIPAYEAENTLEAVVRRIPAGVYEGLDEILIQDDGSRDATFAVAEALARALPKLRVVRNAVNLGYGGTKKKAYLDLVGRGHEAVVMLHGDGQCPPESIPVLLEPLASGRADVVLGSRMLGAPLRGGMPLYKWAGNRMLTGLTNRALGRRLTDYHTGYRAYTAAALAAMDVATCGDGHEISMELILRAVGLGLRIEEVPVPTFYGEGSRSCSLRTSVRYGLTVLKMLPPGRGRGAGCRPRRSRTAAG